MRYESGTGALIVSDIGAAGVSPAGTFQATTNGAGYSTNDLLVAFSDGSWRNITASTTITAPPPSDLTTFGGSIDYEVIIWEATATNGGLGYTTGDYLYEVFNTEVGASTWFFNGGSISTPPISERTIPGGGSTSSDVNVSNLPATTATNAGPATSSTPRVVLADESAATPDIVAYQIGGTGTTLYGTLTSDRTAINSVPPGTITTVGTGPTDAQITGSAPSNGSSGGGGIFRVQYDIVGGAADNIGFAIPGGGLYATEADAIQGANALTIGTGASNATEIRYYDPVAEPKNTLATLRIALAASIGLVDVPGFAQPTSSIPLYTAGALTPEPVAGTTTTTIPLSAVTLSDGVTAGEQADLFTAGTIVHISHSGSGPVTSSYRVRSGSVFPNLSVDLLDPIGPGVANSGVGTVATGGGVKIIPQSMVTVPNNPSITWAEIIVNNSISVLNEAANGDTEADRLLSISAIESKTPTNFLDESNPINFLGQGDVLTMSIADARNWAAYGLGESTSERVYATINFKGGLFNG